MRNSQRNISGRQQVTEHMTVLLPVHHKLDLFRHFSGTFHDICFQCLLEILQTVDRIVEVGDRLMQALRRILRQQLLEMSKSHSTLIEILRPLHDIKAVRAFHESIHPPESTVLFFAEGTTLLKRNHIQRLPRRITAVLHDLLLQKSGHSRNVLHQSRRILKHLMIHPLQDISDRLP